MRRALAPLIIAITLGAAAPAMAADVTVKDFSFVPTVVQIQPGQSVTWHWAGPSDHTVTADPGQVESFNSGELGVGATFTHTFTHNGSFTYFCQIHSFMRATVNVGSPAFPDTTRPRISGLRAKPTKLCSRRTSSCRARATKLTFRLSETATVRLKVASIRHPRKTLKRLTRQLSAGRHSLKVSARGLGVGRYRATLVATDLAGNRSQAASVRFRVVRP
jgi:plastocyanin